MGGHNGTSKMTDAMVEGAIMVLTDMGLSLFIVVLNLMVLNALEHCAA